MKTAACLIFVVISLAQNPANKPNLNDAERQSQANDARCAARESQPVTVNCNQSAGSVADQNEHKTPEGSASQWVLVGIGAITAFVIWLQTKATRESVLKMQQSLGLMEQQRDEMQKAREIANKTLISNVGQELSCGLPVQLA